MPRAKETAPRGNVRPAAGGDGAAVREQYGPDAAAVTAGPRPAADRLDAEQYFVVLGRWHGGWWGDGMTKGDRRLWHQHQQQHQYQRRQPD